MTHERTDVTDTVPNVDDEDRRNFLKILGVTGSVGAASEFALDDLRGVVDSNSASTEELATMGEAIRADLSGTLDAERLSSALTGIESGIARLPELRAEGFPAEPTDAYAEVTAPAWDAYDHLADVGLFEAAEHNLPEFTPEHIRATTTELVQSSPLATALADAGFDKQERTELVVGAATNDERLAEWVSTEALPANPDDYDVEDVAPLQQRAVGGALLWIDELDQHLWQKEVLITDEMFDDGIRHARAMLGGVSLVVRAVRDVAAENERPASELAAGVTAGSAVAILGQEDIAADLFRIDDEMRAPRGGDPT
ncbi:hypothetical protein [Halorussus halophilus]|uniref:hypothetical protein n=1 Tax=Halorussus halophilus TaxID=2650975 RepID=UPI0013018E3B|nr:hypothetical protein [Halorussus halophilus]